MTLAQVLKAYRQKRDHSASPYREAAVLTTLELQQFVVAQDILAEDEARSRVIARVKSPESVKEKVRRNALAVRSLEELDEKIRDTVGVRVVVHYLSQVASVVSFVKGRWQLDGDPEDYISRPEESGYRSVHVNIIRDTTSYSGIRAEIQVRTSNQDSWATKTKDLTYKKDVSALPPAFLRMLRLMSNCLHNADEMADSIREEIQRLRGTRR